MCKRILSPISVDARCRLISRTVTRRRIRRMARTHDLRLMLVKLLVDQDFTTEIEFAIQKAIASIPIQTKGSRSLMGRAWDLARESATLDSGQLRHDGFIVAAGMIAGPGQRKRRRQKHQEN